MSIWLSRVGETGNRVATHLANLLGRLALDHVGNGLAADVEKSFDIHVIGGKDDLEKHLLVDLHELLVPILNVGSLLAGVGVVILGRGGIALVVSAPLENLFEDGFGDLAEAVSVSRVSGEDQVSNSRS